MGPRRRVTRSSSRPVARDGGVQRSATPNSPVGSACAWRPPDRGDPSAERPLRREARSCSGGRHRGQTSRSARWAAPYQQRSICSSLFKDVASDYVQMVTVLEQLPNVIDRAIGSHPGPISTRRHRSSDVWELPPHLPATHSRWCPRAWGRLAGHRSGDAAITRAAEIPNTGTKVAMLVGSGARAACRRSHRAADLGAGAAKPAARKKTCSDEFALGHWLDRPAGYPAQLRDDARLRHTAHRGLQLPATRSSCRNSDQARAVQIDVDPKMIGMRYPYEVNIVADATSALRALIPALAA